MPTSKLQRQVSDYLHENSSYLIRENYRPDWLISERGTRLELDFYIDEIKLAIEVQGAQHYVYVEHFHRSPEGFKKRLQDDRYKKDYCESHEIKFIEISSESEVPDLCKYIRKNNKPSISTDDPNLLYLSNRHPNNRKPLLRPKPISLVTSSTKNNFVSKLSDQGKFNMYTNRLHLWMLGELEIEFPSPSHRRRYLKSAFHNFLEKHTRYVRDIDMDDAFINFLENQYPDERYKEGFVNMKVFFKSKRTVLEDQLLSI